MKVVYIKQSGWKEPAKCFPTDAKRWPNALSDLVIHIVAIRNAPVKGIYARTVKGSYTVNLT